MCVDRRDDVHGATGELIQRPIRSETEPAARAYALAKLPGDERDRLLGRVALVQSKTDPPTAAKLVFEQITPGEVQNEAALSVLQQWGSREPAGAIAWAQTFGDTLRDRAMNEAAPPMTMTNDE